MGKLKSISLIMPLIIYQSCARQGKRPDNSGQTLRDAPQCTIGSGHRGLVVAINTWTLTNRGNFPMQVGCIGNVGYSNEVYFDANRKFNFVLFHDELSRQEFDTIGPRFFSSRSVRRLHSLSDSCAMANGDLFTIEHGRLRIRPGEAQAEARKRYNLTEKQICLGAFDHRVYFWIEGHPKEIFFKAKGQSTYKFNLDEDVFNLMGISNGAPEADLAVLAASHHSAFFHLTPARVHWIGLNFKDAERVE